MPKWRHDNPHAEAQIEALDLRSWESVARRLKREREGERRERALAALRGVPWETLSPAELAFRWMLEHDRERYALWCAEVRAAVLARKAGGHGE